MYKRWKIALWFPNLAGLNAQTCLICSVKVDTGTWCPAFLRWQDIEVKITICWGRTNLFHTLHLNFLHQSVVEDIYRIEMIHLVVNIALLFLVLYNKVRIGLNSVRSCLVLFFLSAFCILCGSWYYITRWELDRTAWNLPCLILSVGIQYTLRFVYNKGRVDLTKYVCRSSPSIRIEMFPAVVRQCSSGGIFMFRRWNMKVPVREHPCSSVGTLHRSPYLRRGGLI